MDEGQLSKLKTAKKNLKLMRLKNAEVKKNIIDSKDNIHLTAAGTRRSVQTSFANHADQSQYDIALERPHRKHGSTLGKSIRSHRMVADSR